MTRKQYSARFKAKVAMEAIRGGKPMNELAVRFGLHPTQIAQWKKQALEGLPEIFANHRGQQGKGEGLEAVLYQQIGRLQMEVAWLKKKYGLAD
jgi:putative transposase